MDIINYVTRILKLTEHATKKCSYTSITTQTADKKSTCASRQYKNPLPSSLQVKDKGKK
jgi:hypothetical protein